MTRQELDIVIVGGGIAGCSAAIALTAIGHKVRILEKQAAWRFQSSGIFVYSNGLASMQELGVMQDMIAAGFAVPDGRNSYFDHHGTPITASFYPSADGGKIPAILGIKRAEIHRVLARRMEQTGVQIDLDSSVAALDQADDRVHLQLTDGRQLDCDLLIGADGVRSVTRSLMGLDLAPRYTGFGVWRSVHRRPADLQDKIMMMGPAKRFGIMPISADRLYTFGTVAEPEDSFFAPADWPRLMQERFAEFGGPAAPFLQELDGEAEVLYTAVEEVVLPLPWHRGRVLLIGDAAHASTPFMGQGGAMAIQDAVILARALTRHSDMEAALTAFGKARTGPCQFVQAVSRAVGEAGANEDSANLASRNAELARTAQEKVDGFYARLDALNLEADEILSQQPAVN
jgi:2-polyprenyl-6-methoxyphenol hydroxylase-like FAD-dependent oxidoreductase